MKVLELNSYDFFSTGNIMLQIADAARKNGIEVYTAAKKTQTSLKKGIKYNHYLIGSRLEHTLNRELSSITDFQDCGSLLATAKFINHIKKINPDIIHIHDIAGYYLNLDLFFGFLKKYKKPVIWTFHCCWAYTGRCIYYDYIKCNKWQTECSHCPQDRNSFPKHLFADFSKHNYLKKKNLFLSLDDLTIVTPSYWLEGEVKKSFFKEKRVVTIHNGINLSDFYPDNSMMLKEKYGITDKIILGVAAVWSNRKGLSTFIELERKLPKGYKIVLIPIYSSICYFIILVEEVHFFLNMFRARRNNDDFAIKIVVWLMGSMAFYGIYEGVTQNNPLFLRFFSENALTDYKNSFLYTYNTVGSMEEALIFAMLLSMSSIFILMMGNKRNKYLLYIVFGIAMFFTNKRSALLMWILVYVIYEVCINKVTIASGVLIAGNVLIEDHFHGDVSSSEADIEPNKRILKSRGEISIGENVWIGENVVIMPGVSIGRGCVIGANSTVTKSIPDYAVAAGSPAKIIRRLKN